jgi:hypothetical protein
MIDSLSETARSLFTAIQSRSVNKENNKINDIYDLEEEDEDNEEYEDDEMDYSKTAVNVRYTYLFFHFGS